MNDRFLLIESLPPKHRKHLLGCFRQQTKAFKASNNTERLQIIAGLLPANEIARYQELYSNDAGRLFAWYKGVIPGETARSANFSSDQVDAKMHAKYNTPLQGERPEIFADQDPLFHRMKRGRNYVELEYAYFGAIISIPDGWDQISARRFKRCAVIVRQAPLTLELRRTPISMRAALLRSVVADLGVPNINSFLPCLVTTADLQEALRVRMGSTAHGERRIGRGRGLGTFSITTDGSVSLLEQIDYLGSQAEHHEVFQRSWWFSTRHDDGYLESAKYFINLETGDLRVSEGISEVAIDNLRRNLLALF